ncbi:hypothetical protein DF19_38390 [Streptomyces olindensis]|nr:hypothetical protein DF19_38390 [Streptomyces olindensis]
MSDSVRSDTAPGTRSASRRSMAVCALIGAAVMASVDEIVFHQLLGWHHFYDRSTSGVGLLSDGLLHTAELLALVAGFFLYADLRHRRALAPAHAWSGFFLGLAAPLLFVVARPLTLALRALRPGRPRRRLLVLARSRPVGWLVLPPLAALLDVGGLWLLYRTELFATMRHQPLLHGVVHAHMLAAGFVFTFAVCQLDPVRRRWSVAVRGATLLAAGTAHAVLAKTLYASPPPGTDFTPADLHRGAQWMYYGGDVVDAAMAVVLGVGWYAAGGRARARRTRRGAAPTGSKTEVDQCSRGTW